MPNKLQSAAHEWDENAVSAVKRYRFAPATDYGRPVPFETKVEVNFRLY
jgi:hypothetical protein